MDWYLNAWRQYAELNGRATRAEFWCFTAVHLMIIVGLCCLALISSEPVSTAAPLATASLMQTSALSTLIAYLIASTPPAVAVTVRRLHDSGRRAGWLIVLLVPVIGIVILAALLSIGSQRWSENPWGPEPSDW